MNRKIKIGCLLLAVFMLSGCVSDRALEGKKEAEQVKKLVEDNNKQLEKKMENILYEEQTTNTPPTEVEIKDYNEKYNTAIIKTSLGDITIKFSNADTPKTVANFMKLADAGFYDGVKFHRVIKGFMIQTGDPLSKDDSQKNAWGTGGPGYVMPAEIKLENKKGTIATARLGDQMNPKKDSSGSQFFINTVDNAFLNGGYTVFGEVTSGMETALKIENVKTTAPGQLDRPVEDVTIKNIELLKK